MLVLVVLFMPDGILARFTRRRAGPSIPDESAGQRLQGVTR
ncbi:hypothetical protein [[Actinomadura] parvosata]|nr:hypothetical protein [Nonomuraea sp. ATCC 55076]